MVMAGMVRMMSSLDDTNSDLVKIGLNNVRGCFFLLLCNSEIDDYRMRCERTCLCVCCCRFYVNDKLDDIYIYIYLHTHTHTHIYIYIFTHTHTHTQTHTHIDA